MHVVSHRSHLVSLFRNNETEQNSVRLFKIAVNRVTVYSKTFVSRLSVSFRHFCADFTKYQDMNLLIIYIYIALFFNPMHFNIS